jgi:hypothetical protein
VILEIPGESFFSKPFEISNLISNLTLFLTRFVTLESEDEARTVLEQIRLKKRLFRGQHIKARVKSEATVRSYYPVRAPVAPPVFAPVTEGGYPPAAAGMPSMAISGPFVTVPPPYGYSFLPASTGTPAAVLSANMLSLMQISSLTGVMNLPPGTTIAPTDLVLDPMTADAFMGAGHIPLVAHQGVVGPNSVPGNGAYYSTGKPREKKLVSCYHVYL